MLTPIFGDDTKMKYMIPEERDVTTSKKIETSLKTNEERYRLLFTIGTDVKYVHEIEDNGPGMPEKYMVRILFFEM